MGDYVLHNLTKKKNNNKKQQLMQMGYSFAQSASPAPECIVAARGLIVSLEDLLYLLQMRLRMVNVLTLASCV